MRKTPVYGFDDLTSLGIDTVPNFSHVLVEDAGNGRTRLYMKVANTGLTVTSTIQDFLNNASLYEDVYSYDPVEKTSDPDANDDETMGYEAGQILVNTTSNAIFILADATAGSAVWKRSESMSASEILSELLTVDGAGSGLDADTLDGQQLSDLDDRYVSATHDDTMTGLLTLQTNDPHLIFDNTGGSSDDFTVGSSGRLFSVSSNGSGANTPLVLDNSSSKAYIYGDEVITEDTMEKSELERITEGSNSGWRLLGSDPDFYGDIGEDAVDLSHQHYVSSTSGATGIHSNATGSTTTASGDTSHAEGYLTVASGATSHAEGRDSVASGDNSHAEGGGTTASGNGSHAGGSGTKSVGSFSFAHGNSSEAHGQSSVAFGADSYTYGESSVAIGQSNHADGTCAASFGGGTIAHGNYTAAFGRGTISRGDYTFSAGSYNLGSDVNTILEIGVGTSTSNRRNALEVYKNGTILAPELAISEITNNKSLVTKEYVDGSTTGSYVRISGDNMTGSLTTNNNVPIGIGVTPNGNLSNANAIAIGADNTGIIGNSSSIRVITADSTRLTVDDASMRTASGIAIGVGVSPTGTIAASAGIAIGDSDTGLRGNSGLRLYHNNSEIAIFDTTDITLQRILDARFGVNVGRSGGGDSNINFYDDNSNTWRTLGWDDSENNFVLETGDGVQGHVILHEDSVVNGGTY
jgi:hypothetical protein